MLHIFSDPEMLNISVTRVRIPDCCKECQESEEEVSGCSCSTAEPVSDSDSTVSVERLFILHHVTPEVLNEGMLVFEVSFYPQKKIHLDFYCRTKVSLPYVLVFLPSFLHLYLLMCSYCPVQIGGCFASSSC